MHYKGQAIKLVNVAERLETGKQSPGIGVVVSEVGMSEAWRGFCRPVAIILKHYECRACPADAKQ